MVDLELKSGSVVSIENLEAEHKFLRAFMREMNEYLSSIIDNKSNEIYRSARIGGKGAGKRELHKNRHNDAYKIQFLESLKRNNGR